MDTDGIVDVVVIGGGYAGVTAANRLTQRADVRVTLVNPREAFVERIRLHQRVAGTHAATVAYRDVLAERVDLVVDAVERVDADTRTLTLASGRTLAYGYAVYAVGSGSADPRVPGAAAHAYPITSLEEAERLRPALAGTGGPVVVAGGGLSGVEVAAELAEAGRRVTLACGGALAPSLHARGRRSVAARLAKLGVRVLEGPGTKVAAVTAGTVALADGRELPSAVTVWTAGFGVPDLAARSGLSTDPLGRLLTDETLTSVDSAYIVAAGDSAAPSGLPFRMSCQAAGPLGAHAADTVLHRIAGEEATPVALGFIAQCVSIGRKAGVFQFVNPDDSPKAVHIGGGLGARIKEMVCKGTVRHLVKEARKPGSAAASRAVDKARVEALGARTGAGPEGRS